MTEKIQWQEKCGGKSFILSQRRITHGPPPRAREGVTIIMVAKLVGTNWVGHLRGPDPSAVAVFDTHLVGLHCCRQLTTRCLSLDTFDFAAAGITRDREP